MVGDQLSIVVGWNIPGVGAYFEFFNLDEAEATLSSVRLSLVFAAPRLDPARSAARGVRCPASREARGDRGPGRVVDRRWTTRHAPRDIGRPRSARPHRVVQRHGRSAPAAGRTRRPLRLGRESRTALAVDDARGVGRGDGGPPGRDAGARPGRPRPAVERRGPVPGARRGPARDLPLRRRRDPAAPRGAARGRVRPPGRRRQLDSLHAHSRVRTAPSTPSSAATAGASPV